MRLTRRVFDDLALWMVGFGLFIGVVFPPAVVLFGVPRAIALTPFFFAVCVLAGCMVGAVNIGLVRWVVLPRLRALADGMLQVEDGIREATYTGDWSKCDPERCKLPVDSDDVIGESASAFNKLIFALTRSHDVEARVGDFTAAMSAQLELAPLCQGAVAAFMQATGAQAAVILADTGGELSVLASHGVEDTAPLVTDDHVRLCLRSGQPDRVELPEDLEVRGGLVTFRPREVTYLPLVAQAVPIGVVVLARSSPFEPETRSLSTIFARTFAMALANAMTHDHLQRIAALDPLTGCYNRRFGLGRLREEFGRAARNDTPLAGILFDIDHFKSVNDTYGHLVGDRVLTAVAKAAKERLREGDILVRYGGEEFLAILPGAATGDAREISERIRRAVEEHVVQDGSQAIQCTVSLGYVATPDVRVEDETELIRIADEALYRAKGAGRNRALPGQT